MTESGACFIELDTSRHNRQNFDCGAPELNEFLRKSAARHRRAGISKTMVLPESAPPKGLTDVLAFYTLSHTGNRAPNQAFQIRAATGF